MTPELANCSDISNRVCSMIPALTPIVGNRAVCIGVFGLSEAMLAFSDFSSGKYASSSGGFEAAPAVPDRIVGALDRCFEPLAYRRRFRTILLERHVELDRARAERLDIGFLDSVKTIGGADQRSQHQRQQQRDETHDRADHLSRPRSHVIFRQQLLQLHAEISETECQNPGRERYQHVRHAGSPLSPPLDVASRVEVRIPGPPRPTSRAI